MTKFFVDKSGKYLGGWDTPESEYPPGAIEIPAPPEHAADVLLENGTWDTSGRPVDNEPA